MRVAHGWRWWLYLTHRWLGIVSCLLFAIWFASGLVMIYVPFPALTRAERVAGLAPIDWPLVRVSPGSALRAADYITPPRALVVEMRDGRPVYWIEQWDGDPIGLSAVDGGPLPPTTAASARRTAAGFGRRAVRSIERLERDQWTVAGGFDRHRPLWKASLAGDDGRILYVSSTTGQVVLDTDRRERFWNWLGSVPHWIYPTVLRQDNAAWRQVVMWVSFPCIVAAVAGMWIGILRLRLGRRRFNGQRITPYRGWMEWHHVAGLVGGLTLTAWMFSGWLSVDPFRLFASPGIGLERRIDYGGSVMPAALPPTLATIAAGASRVEWRWAAGRMLIAVEWPGRSVQTLDAATLSSPSIDQPALLRQASLLVPGARIRSTERMTEPDMYWYSVGERPTLPALLVKFDDAAGTWIYLDPATGNMLEDLDRRRRVYRWLFDLLHKWDVNPLTLHRPLWDAVLWLLSLAGIVTSISGIVIGWRRLVRRRHAA